VKQLPNAVMSGVSPVPLLSISFSRIAAPSLVEASFVGRNCIYCGSGLY
jgi:hypothetical protein